MRYILFEGCQNSIADVYSRYSGVPNKRAGSNKRAGWKFNGILIIEQAIINEQGGNFLKFQ